MVWCHRHPAFGRGWRLSDSPPTFVCVSLTPLVYPDPARCLLASWPAATGENVAGKKGGNESGRPAGAGDVRVVSYRRWWLFGRRKESVLSSALSFFSLADLPCNGMASSVDVRCEILFVSCSTNVQIKSD
ncbi:hypothetical protein GQ55_8G167200 [Panicum hallii var. hallii]|uniref:Uncharacterized protein n=1 Tax=Panicum hallii var. hallii TaxID=1504633 RepID=A0A2T7CNE2_9POAL|nr:hypothetical protein GQ55_8G167200 [Panicum hallii var. hallii]